MNQDRENCRVYHLFLQSGYENGWTIEMTEVATFCSARGSVV